MPPIFDFARRPLAAIAAAAALMAVGFVTVAYPLAAYTTVLAVFGPAHVGSELRFVDYRFGPRLRFRLIVMLAAGLAVALLVRIAGMAGLISYQPAIAAEIVIVAVMTAMAAAGMRQNRFIGIAISGTLFLCAVAAPVLAFLLLAFAHNLTPLGFLADALQGRERRRVLAVAAAAFVAVPALIATGLPQMLLAHAGLAAPYATLFAGGTLADNLAAYIPADYLDAPWAVNLFSAAVFAQCMHYFVVIVVLPRLIDAPAMPRTVLSWPAAQPFALLLAAIAIVLVGGFSVDYGVARKFYALAAMVHAWIEIPLLVLALDRGLVTTARATPARPA